MEVLLLIPIAIWIVIALLRRIRRPVSPPQSRRPRNGRPQHKVPGSPPPGSRHTGHARRYSG